jgi:hypothetical protein
VWLCVCVFLERDGCELRKYVLGPLELFDDGLKGELGDAVSRVLRVVQRSQDYHRIVRECVEDLQTRHIQLVFLLLDLDIHRVEPLPLRIHLKELVQ